jgi:MoaA/NifB/PqqE/SkfB family radical SAM enzyme
MPRSFAAGSFTYLTNKCQLNCAHCSFLSGADQSNTHLDSTVLLNVLDELECIGDITLSGGEPMLHPDFDAVHSKATESAGIVYLMTLALT